MEEDRISLIFAALADPTRRTILARLAEGEASVTELAEPFDMTMPAISKHLKVLERAGLISRGREAQWRPCRLDVRDRQETLRDRLVEGVLALGDGCVLTGHPVERLPHNASFAFRDLSGNDLLIHLDAAGIAASSGSACSTGNPRPSTILQALGLQDEWTRGGLRLTVGRHNSDEDINRFLDALPRIVTTLRAFQFDYA